MSDSEYDRNLLLQNRIRFKKTFSGKIRNYFSLRNITDLFKTGMGVSKTILSIYFDFPDVIFSKGAYVSFPAVFAAKILGIPLIVHESDSIPGKVNAWSGKFSKRVAISFPDTARYFPEGRTALTGTPIRKEFFDPITKENARVFLGLEAATPVITIVGGSQGAQIINDNILDILPELLNKYQILHQCGKNNLSEIKERTSVLLENSPFKSRYHLFDYLDLSQSKNVLGAADLVISRAGSSIFELAAMGLPSILVPLENSAQDHQRKNAFYYASQGAADVIEENNLTPHVLKAEIERLMGDQNKLNKMSEAAKKLAKPDAAEKIAREIIALAIEHA